MALRVKGETASELAGFARAMRERMVGVDAGPDVIDIVGTGGDGAGTFNISTVAAMVLAGAGARVAKHGNRAISGKVGSADVLEALGVRIALTPEEAAGAMREIGLGFLFAPHLHPAMKNVQPVRRELKMRTVFNLLGPLCESGARADAGDRGAVGGVAEIMAEALAELGTGHSFVVHGVLAGGGGLDEVSTTGSTEVYEVWTGGWRNAYGHRKILVYRRLRWMRSQVAMRRERQDCPGAARRSAGSEAGYRPSECGGRADGRGSAATPREGVANAADAIDSGRAMAVLNNCNEIFRKRYNATGGADGERSSSSAAGPRIREPWPRPQPSADIRSGFADKTICSGLA